MKIILSKKGIDSSNCSNGVKVELGKELLFIPIPNICDLHKYQDIENYYENKNLLQVAEKYIKNCKFTLNIPAKKLKDNFKIGCHFDPQLKNCFGGKFQKKFRASFGQVDKAQSYLNANIIDCGDIFLFYGWFYDVEEKKDKHIIWGYMQVGDIITFDKNGNCCSRILNNDKCKIEEAYPFLKNQTHWVNYKKYLKDSKNNTIYISNNFLKSKENEILKTKGYGIFKYDKRLDLTAKNAKSKSDWNVEALKNVKVNFNSKKLGEYKFDENGNIKIAKGFGQEFVLYENDKVINWVMNLIKETEKI